MAFNAGDIVAHLKANTVEFQKGMAQAQNSTNKFGSGFSKVAKVAAVGIAAASAATVAFGVKSVKAYQESEQAAAQLNAVLKSTKGAAGVSAKAANNLATKLSLLNAVDDEAILGAENMLLTFTNIGKDIFPQTTQSVIDMATAMNGGAIPSAEQLRNTTIQLGKALQSPDAGLGALKRVGINVDELKKKFTDSMSVQEKQKLILKELASEFGGSGAAAANTFGGKIEKLKIAFGNLQENIGEVIVNAITPLANRLSAFVSSDKFQAWVVQVNKWIATNLPLAINWLTTQGIPFLVSAFNTLWPVIKTTFGIFKSLIEFANKNRWVIYALATAFGVLKVAMMLNGALTAFKGVMAGVRASYLITRALLTSPILITIAVGAALIALELIRRKAVDTWDTIENMQQAISKSKSAQSDARARLERLSQTGTPAQRARAKSQLKKGGASGAFASGTLNAPGGLSLVGEMGPELVNLPRGSQVIPNNRLRNVMGSSISNNIGTVIINKDADGENWLKKLTRSDELVSRGMSA